MTISVTYEDKAGESLLRIALWVENIRVADFGRRKYDLEEIFMDPVEGTDNEADVLFSAYVFTDKND